MQHMDHILSLVNVATSCGLAALAGWAVITPAVRDGVIVKIGLIAMSTGHGVAAMHLFDGIAQADLLGLNKARFISNIGLVLVLGGYWWRYRRGERINDIVPSLGERL